MTDTHSFKNTVVAVFESSAESGKAVEDLSSAGYDYEVLQGETGSDHLDPAGEGGVLAALKRMATALSDESQIVERLDEELGEGNVVVSVEVEEENASGAISILRDHGGRFIWKFGEWAFTPIEI